MSTTTVKRGPGRPPKQRLDEPSRDRETRNEGDLTERRRRRAERADVLGYRLQIPREKLELEKFVYRWVSDKEARVFAVTKQDDWDFVHQDNGEIKSDADVGSGISVVSGRKDDGSPMRQHLMRKPRGYWEEDQAKIAEESEKLFTEMRRGNDPDGSRAPNTYAVEGNSL